MDCGAKYGRIEVKGSRRVQSTAPLGEVPLTTVSGLRGRLKLPPLPIIALPGFCATLSTMSMNSMHRAAIPVLALLGLTGCYTSSSMDWDQSDAGPAETIDTADVLEDEAAMDEDAGPECPLWGTSVFVDYVHAISELSEGFVTLTLRGGQQFRLDVQTARGEIWTEMLELHYVEHKPVYLEIDDPGTMTITKVIMTLESPVHDLRTAAEGTEVELDYSAAIHFLHLSHPCYEQMLAALETALSRDSAVLVSTDCNDGSRILDVHEPLEP